MAREIRELAGYLALSLLLVGAAELAVATLDVPRLWALIATFTLGYATVAVVKWRLRTENASSANAVRPETPRTNDASSEAGAHDAPEGEAPATGTSPDTTPRDSAG